MSESSEISIEENENTTLDSYSLLFDKAKHNFSTSSEISFNKENLPLIDENQTITDGSKNFNPFLLLFLSNDEVFNTNDNDPKIWEHVDTGQGSLISKTGTCYQQNRLNRQIMLKHITHSHHGKLHTFDDFYRDNSKPIRTRSSTNDLTSATNSFPTSPYFKSTITPDVVLEEDETEEENNTIPEQSTPPTAVFYLEDEHPNQSQSPSSTSSPHWPSLILNRFRHAHHHHHHTLVKQNSVNENQMNLTKLRKSDSTDSSFTKHRFLKRSQTINHTDSLADKKSSTDDFPELSLATNNNIVKKHRSFVSLLHHFHHNHQHQNSSKKHPDRSNSTGTLDIEKLNINSTEFPRQKVIKQKTLPSTNNDEQYSPVKKSPSTPILPKLVSLFHRHHLSEQHKYRVGNLKARLHHRRNSPPLMNTAPKFQCQISNELIEEIKKLEEEQLIDQDYMSSSRPTKPVVMKRVHTWHNSFDLRPVDQNSFKSRRTNQKSDDEEDDQAFEKFLQEHRTLKSVENKSPVEQKRKNRNSLKDFICDSSSSSEEDPSEFYTKVNRIIDKDLSWRQNEDDDETSEESDESSTSSSESEVGLKPTKKKDTKINVTFLESLSNYVPIEHKHIDAKQYFTKSGFKNKTKRQELAEKLFSIFDHDVFSSKLSDKVTTIWSARLTATAGHCTTRRTSQTATITLSQKVCDSPERCRDTLLHEMCHAAVSLIDGVMNGGHGRLWRKWTHKAERCYPYLPAISVKHTYDITYKFIYRCTRCQYEVQRHSKSLDIEIDVCGKCMGKFELLLNNTKTNDVQTPKKTLTRYNLFIKEHFQIMKQAQPHLSSPQLMKHLSQEYKKTIQQEKQTEIDLPNFEQLKI
ncbi:hypothetical protein I4U23_017457 [Adineta vaga]|nr:hypothetical protein I4U23_017457 [Adineta vaga]